MNFEKDLNEKQYEAVTTPYRNVRIIAGAGSGKTRVLTYRIAYLISELKVVPWRILAITFTNKVAGEMKNRVIKMIPEAEPDLTIKTFHSFAAMFLRREISSLNFPASFTILDEEDQVKLVKDIVAELGFKRSDKIAGKAISYIGSQKLHERYPDDINIVKETFEDEKLCLQIYTRYEEEKSKQMSLDFDDLLLKTIYILEVIGVLASLALIPLALRGFKKMVDRLDEKEYPEEKIEKIYMACSWLRLLAFFMVVEFGVILYYLINDSIGLYIAAIGAICSLFSFPTKAGVEHETGFY